MVFLVNCTDIIEELNLSRTDNFKEITVYLRLA